MMGGETEGRTKAPKTEIVKIQISLLDKDGPRIVNVSNEDETLTWQGGPTEKFAQLLGSRDRAYFYARVVRNQLQLGQEAPQQRW